MIDYTVPLDELPDPLLIEPLAKPFDVTITPPGSKSITNRAYVLAALARGESRIIRPLRSDDCDNLLAALCTLGAEARWEDEDVLIRGVAGRFPRGGSVNLGDGGAPTRFMIACACLAAEPVIVDGSPRMRERPIAEGIDMLRQLGAHIEYVEEEGRLPVRVVPSEDFKGGELTVGKTASSQFISASLLIGSCLTEGIKIRHKGELTSRTYVDLTNGVLDAWHVHAQERKWGLREEDLEYGFHINARIPECNSYLIAPDASSATYWWAAAGLVQGASVFTPGITGFPGQPDEQFLGAMQTIGAANWSEGVGEIYDLSEGGVGVRGAKEIRPLSSEFDFSLMPDATMTFGVVSAMAVKSATITGLHTLRVKETDRVAALASELRRIGCTVETTDDSITIDPSTRHDEPVVIETYNDHRMAMAFAVLGLARPGISIRDPKCVKKSYPGFWRDFAKLYQ